MLAMALVVLVACAVPSDAAAGTCRPLNEGGMIFGRINGPEDPEDYCFEVTLGEEQELEQIDSRTVGAFYNTGQPSFDITAEEAHDAEGVTVPTTLAKTGENLITLTVHHREGNPLAGWAPFHYPVVAGSGWEGGFRTVEAQISPGSHPQPAEEAPAPQCVVPRLHGRSLRAARSALHAATCQLGPVRGDRSRAAHVIKQYRPAGATLPAGTSVGVKLAS